MRDFVMLLLLPGTAGLLSGRLNDFVQQCNFTCCRKENDFCHQSDQKCKCLMTRSTSLMWNWLGTNWSNYAPVWHTPVNLWTIREQSMVKVCLLISSEYFYLWAGVHFGRTSLGSRLENTRVSTQPRPVSWYGIFSSECWTRLMFVHFAQQFTPTEF